jgi:transposase
VAPKGIAHVRDLLAVLETGGALPLPDLARQTLLLIAQMIDALSRAPTAGSAAITRAG